MKKFLVSAIILAMLLTLVSVPASAIPEGCTAVDITSEVKFASAMQMYDQGLAIIREDATFVESFDYDQASLVGSTSAATVRSIKVSDFDDAAHRNQAQFDVHNYGDGDFLYTCIWASNASATETSKVVYKFNAPESGEYEFVFAGAAEIKAENVGNPERDRGFSFSIDGGEKKQVNISNSPLQCRGYNYEYTVAEALACVTEGTYAKYQIGYVYNIKVQLTAGEHTLEYYHLEYSGDTITNTTNNSRLNFAGFYYQKAIDQVAFDNYVFPEAEAETTEEETTGEVTTGNNDDTSGAEQTTDKAPEDDKTDKPSSGNNNTPTTDPVAEPSGCGSTVSAAAICFAFVGAAFVISKRRK